MDDVEKARCEGFRRYGGAFSFGPVTWKQCENDATVSMNVVQDGVEQRFLACHTCWVEAYSSKEIKILEVHPI